LDAGVTPAPSASLRHLSCEGEAVYDGFFDFAIKALDLLDDLDSDCLIVIMFKMMVSTNFRFSGLGIFSIFFTTKA